MKSIPHRASGPAAALASLLSVAASGAAQSPTAFTSLSGGVSVEPIAIAQVFSDGTAGQWHPYVVRKGVEEPMASNITFGAGETTKLRDPGPTFIPTDGSACGGFGQPCGQPCSQTRRILQTCGLTNGGMRISATSSVNSTGDPGNVTQVFLAWANKRAAGETDDFNPPRVINETVIEVLIYDDWFDPNCGPATPNLIGGVLVNFGRLDAQCGTDNYFFSTVNLRDFPDVCLTVPGPAADFGYEVAFWFDADRSARAANNQVMLWGTKDRTLQGATLEIGYVDANYDGQYSPPSECINLRSGGCPEILAAMVDFWGNTVPGNVNLWDNGAFVTGLRTGCSGRDVSLVEPPSTVFGYDTQVSRFHQADDFKVPSGQTWQIDDMRWYVYQTDATPVEPITAAYVRVWDGPPGAGGSIIAGDMTTNRLLASEFMSTYRAIASDPTSCRRAVKRITVNLSWLGQLSAGTYWLELGTEGNPGFGGPFAAPTVPRDPSTDNSRSLNVASGVWSANVDTTSGFPFDFPFELEGKIISGGPCKIGGYTVAIAGACPGSVRLEWSGAEPSRQQGIVFARNLGNYMIGSGPCVGTRLGLGTNGLMLFAVIGTGSGSGSLNANAGPGACRGYVQLITVPSCATSNVTQVP